MALLKCDFNQKLAAQPEMFIRLVQSSELLYLLPEASPCITIVYPLLKA